MSSGYWSVIGEFYIEINKVINVLNIILNDVISDEQATLIQCLINELQNQDFTNIRNSHFGDLELSSRNRPLTNPRMNSALTSNDHFGEMRGVFSEFVGPMHFHLGQRFSVGLNPAAANSSLADLDNNWRH